MAFLPTIRGTANVQAGERAKPWGRQGKATNRSSVPPRTVWALYSPATPVLLTLRPNLQVLSYFEGELGGTVVEVLRGCASGVPPTAGTGRERGGTSCVIGVCAGRPEIELGVTASRMRATQHKRAGCSCPANSTNRPEWAVPLGPCQPRNPCNSAVCDLPSAQKSSTGELTGRAVAMQPPNFRSYNRRPVLLEQRATRNSSQLASALRRLLQ